MRTIRKSATRSALDVLDLLAALLALEVVRPSRCLWLASPWVTDLPIIDNRFGDFPALDPVGRRKVTLSEVLVAIACESATVVVATRRDPINDGFTERLRQLAILHDVEDQVSVQFVAPADRMHGKALVGDDFVIAGSMNFTYSGVMLNEEQVQFHTEDDFVADTQRALFDQYGGVLA